MTHRTATQLILTALDLLPPALRHPHAARFLLAIGKQESDWTARTQHRGGPARGFFQFESIGVAEVFRHPKSAALARQLLADLHYPAQYPPLLLHDALAHNDLLAIGVARLALWREPQPLPGPDGIEDAWMQYQRIWRPGKPRVEKWPDSWAWSALGDRP